jgi:hypothetical protein
MKAIHTPTGFSCEVMINEGARCFCNFGARINPFAWVNTNELQTINNDAFVNAKPLSDGSKVFDVVAYDGRIVIECASQSDADCLALKLNKYALGFTITSQF